MKQLTDIELKKASIFDLTDDIQKIRDAMEMKDIESNEIDAWTNEAKIESLFAYAEHTKDNDLLKRLEVLFPEAFSWDCTRDAR